MPAEVRDLSFVQNVQAICTTHTDLLQNGCWGILPWGKEAEMPTTYPHLLAKLRKSGALNLKLYFLFFILMLEFSRKECGNNTENISQATS
jgi:hypothetical protein